MTGPLLILIHLFSEAAGAASTHRLDDLLAGLSDVDSLRKERIVGIDGALLFARGGANPILILAAESDIEVADCLTRFP